MKILLKIALILLSLLLVGLIIYAVVLLRDSGGSEGARLLSRIGIICK